MSTQKNAASQEDILNQEIDEIQTRFEGSRSPSWALEPLREFMVAWRERRNFSELLLAALRATQGLPDVMQAVADTGRVIDPGRMARVVENAARAKQESDSGHATLGAFGTVFLWSALEAGIEDFLIACISNRPARLKADLREKTKVPLSFFDWTEHERGRHVLHILERERASPGISRFEDLLDCVDLGGAVDASVRTSLLALSQVRHVLVHRRGVADATLVQHCPALGYRDGDRVVVSDAVLREWDAAALRYVLIVLNRILDRLGPDEPATTPTVGETKQPAERRGGFGVPPSGPHSRV